MQHEEPAVAHLKGMHLLYAQIDGLLLVIEGPGSGKTYSILLRALNLLLLKKTEPEQVALCTFNEKAAFELRDRLAAAARTVGYKGYLSELRTCTIHSLCSRILSQHRHRTELGHNYDTLDELTQLLLIFMHFDKTVRRIQAREYAVAAPSEAAICKECDLKTLCHAEGVIGREAALA